MLGARRRCPRARCPRARAYRPCYQASAGRTAQTSTSRRAEGRTRSTSGPGGSGLRRRWRLRSGRRGATPPRRPPRHSSAFKPASRPTTAPPRPPPPPSEPLESWWPPARDGQASTLSLASTLPRTPARRRAIRSEPSLSFPAWYPTAARLALWPHSTGVPSPAPAHRPLRQRRSTTPRPTTARARTHARRSRRVRCGARTTRR